MLFAFRLLVVFSVLDWLCLLLVVSFIWFVRFCSLVYLLVCFSVLILWVVVHVISVCTDWLGCLLFVLMLFDVV